jgi:hypothetical protein
MQVHPEALTDAYDAADWYDEQRAGYGGAFLEDFFTTVEAIEQFPTGAPALEFGDAFCNASPTS